MRRTDVVHINCPEKSEHYQKLEVSTVAIWKRLSPMQVCTRPVQEMLLASRMPLARNESATYAGASPEERLRV
jgi:hypothetical protein